MSTEFAPYFAEAMNTLRASRFTLFLACLFGKHHMGEDAVFAVVHFVKWRGKVYLIDLERRVECKDEDFYPAPDRRGAR